MNVAQFAAGGLAVTFKDAPEDLPPPLHGRTQTETIEDESRSTSSKQIRGFDSSQAEVSAWRNPHLWRGQGGKVLRFDGGLE